jgi:hypothetical protein
LAKRYRSAPSVQTDPSKSYPAIFHNSRGDFTVDLRVKEAPVFVNSVVCLAPVTYTDLTADRP